MGGDSSMIVGILLTFILYRLWVVVYRLYFHPLAKFPGPKLTAATYLISAYYELFHDGGGQFQQAYRRWHDQYGPIIRIDPDQLHIRDSSYYDTIFSSTRPARKIKNFGVRLSNELAAFGAEDPATHRTRRLGLNLFFSRRKVAEHGVKIQALMDQLLERVHEEYCLTRQVLNVSKMWECFASDNIMSFAFGQESNFITTPGFHSTINEAMFNITEQLHWFWHVPWLLTVTQALPVSFVQWLSPEAGAMLAFWQEQDEQIAKVLEAHDKGEKLGDNMFAALLEQDPLRHDITQGRLEGEAKSVVGAGGETVARALSVATFHILDQPGVKERLIAELHEAISNECSPPSFDQLTHLPYLTACIEEALRLTYGVTERRARAYDGGGLTYRSWTIEPGTFVSMDTWDVAHDEAIFPDPHRFIPDRWLGNPKAPDGRSLSSYMVSFGKGTRKCVGLQLAYAEMCIALAALFRSSLGQKARLWETGESDVAMARCCVVPRAKKGSRGVRVTFDNDST